MEDQVKFANPLAESEDGSPVANRESTKLKNRASTKVDNPMDNIKMSSDLMLHMQSMDSKE